MADLGEIWDYTANTWGADQADRYIRAIVTAFEGIADGSVRGRSAETQRPGYRSAHAGSHVLFYRTGADRGIEIIRILHARMDPERHL